MSSSTTTPTREAPGGRSTKPQVGQTVLVQVDTQVARPLIVTDVHPGDRISGTLFCEPGDNSLPAFRGCPGIDTTPTRFLPLARARQIPYGTRLGEWPFRP